MSAYTLRFQKTYRRWRVRHGAALPCWHSPAAGGREILDWWRQPVHIILAILFFLLCLVYIAQASIHWLAVIDDAYITFRFVDLFAQGHGWRFSVGGPRVEGFTNFLWALILVVPHKLGGDLMFWSKLLGLGCGLTTMLAAWRLAAVIRSRDDFFNLLAPAFLATNSHFGHWALMGLETLLQTALVTATYYRFERERRDDRRWLISPVLAFLAATTRIDSLYYLAPLGLYGWWLVGLRGMPVKRLLLWAVIAAVPFVAFNAWRVHYFGDFFPNTYYAKQRLVVNEGHGRGLEHLSQFYFHQASYGMAAPTPWADISTDSPDATARRLSSIVYHITMARYHSWAWMNFWLLGAGLTSLAAATSLLLRRRYRRASRFLTEPHAAKHICLILLPWALNVYYVYHVNGDWMPGFRFLQVVIPFMGVAAAVGFGWLGDVVRVACGRGLRFVFVSTISLLGGVWLCLGQAYEQLDIGHIYVFGRNSVHTGPRESGWWRWEQVVRAYRRGFVPPLEYVSNWMLLNTQNDAWIFMSDIGQPLWFSEHLGLYDVDGLTDPYLAHAPSVRGNLPSVEDHYRDIVAERGPPTTRAEQRLYMEQARHRDFEAHIRRNTAYIMEDAKPEYLLIFLNHETESPTSRGWAYPRISESVYNHPGMANYVHMGNIPKVGRVQNHFYRRSDVPATIPDSVKFDRMIRAIERNPRMPLLVVLLYEQSMELDMTLEQRELVRRIVERAMERWASDPVVGRLAELARRDNDPALARQALRHSIRANPREPSNYITLSNILLRDGDDAEALRIAEAGIPHQPPRSNTLFYHLVWAAESARDFDKARLYARMAVERRPDDTRAWSDLAAMLDRISHDPSFTTREALELKRESLAAFEKLVEVGRSRPGYISDVMERIEQQIRDLENAAP